ncbi:abortive infection family protein [Aureimonas ureilytica]|uniref:abortive infection family protein n=1 Tax=Aureimonas ureilytica TaxID=401562 RepID=UPI003CEFE565
MNYKLGNPDDIPDSVVEQVTMMEGILVASATGGSSDNRVYVTLRQTFMADPIIRDLLPPFVRTYRSLDAFWPYIKNEAGTYAERRQIIGAAFTPLMDHLEGRNRAPSDMSASDALATFDAEGVHVVWAKALARRATDPEGAITVARTLLETVSKRILDEVGQPYDDKDDLPKLYMNAAKALNLAPNQHTEEPIKAILGGAMNLVNGIGTLRNRLSDSHGRGGRLPVKPSPRHASLAVNTAGAIATFLVETYLDREGKA